MNWEYRFTNKGLDMEHGMKYTMGVSSGDPTLIIKDLVSGAEFEIWQDFEESNYPKETYNLVTGLLGPGEVQSETPEQLADVFFRLINENLRSVTEALLVQKFLRVNGLSPQTESIMEDGDHNWDFIFGEEDTRKLTELFNKYTTDG